VVWVLGSDHWNQADRDDPRKILAKEVVAALNARAHWLSRNGAEHGAKNEKGVEQNEGLQPPAQGPGDR
jgi:hypothetical protein